MKTKNRRKWSVNLPINTPSATDAYSTSHNTNSNNSNQKNDVNFFARSYVGSFHNTFNSNNSMGQENTSLPLYHKNRKSSLSHANGSYQPSNENGIDYEDADSEEIIVDANGNGLDSAYPRNTPNIHLNGALHEQTVALSNAYDIHQDADGNDLVDEQDNAQMDQQHDSQQNKRLSFDADYSANYEYSSHNNGSITPGRAEQMDEQDLLLLSAISSNTSSVNYATIPGEDTTTSSTDSSTSGISSKNNINVKEIYKYLTNPIFTAKQCVKYMPAVILGLLLNILDALSYGMIIFPITEPIFQHLGPSGLSLFYISSIISQLCYSCGLSDFGCAIGSEMIEITPFFHTMAGMISTYYANDPAHQDAIIATTLVSYCVSSILTGLTFYILGKLKLGKIVGFFPRHILIGCIGGVGYFLCITGIEVSTRIAKFEYNYKFLIDFITQDANWAKLLLPLLLTLALIKAQKIFQNNSLVLPVFYIVTFVLFHFIVIITPTLSMRMLRDNGWVFPLADTKESWFDFYSLFKFNKVNWSLVAQNVPTMLALTFFGILHVPINVPALAMSTGCDKFDVDTELIAHGYSNFISGIFGSIQNYLVYTNSVLFIRAGADSRFAGILLAIMTFVVMVIGPVLISLIPICIVGSLIFLLGYELIKEALFDTWGKLSVFEYLTIMIIVGTMGIFDFVLGIIVGILIACFSFLLDSTKLKTVNGEYDGTVAHSTVNRDYWQTKLLNEIGKQIYVLKLQNLLFFGTIISIEEKIDNMLNNEKIIIKYLILDFKNINADNIDYSAAEGFNRIKRFLDSKKIHLIISSINETDKIYDVFNKVGLLQGIELFNNLNSALEWCENKFLLQYRLLQDKKRKKLSQVHKNSLSKHQLQTQLIRGQQKKPANSLAPAGESFKANSQNLSPFPKTGVRNSISMLSSTPRNNQFFNVAKNIYSTEQDIGTNLQEKYDNNLVYQNFLHSLKMFIEPQDFGKWEKIQSYFRFQKLPPGDTISNDNCFFFVENGLLKISYFVMNNTNRESIYETISNKCCYGKISGDGYAKVAPNYKDEVYCETECSIWIIDENSLKTLRREDPTLFTDLIILIGALNQYRYKKLLAYSLVSS
ncbi:hypothetical protein ACO0RG_001571 [Hanseniaspora osmophila]